MPDAARYALLKRAGLCPSCKRRAPVGYVYCVACRKQIAAYQAGGQSQERRRGRLREAGSCLDCGAVKPDVRGKVPRCDACRAAFNQERRTAAAQRRQHGRCAECGEEPTTGYYAGLGPHCSERHARSLARRRAG